MKVSSVVLPESAAHYHVIFVFLPRDHRFRSTEHLTNQDRSLTFGNLGDGRQRVDKTRRLGCATHHTPHCVRSSIVAQIPLGSSRHVSTRHDTTSSTCRARRDERIEPCCSTSSTQPKCMGSTCRTCRVVSRRDETNQVEFRLYTNNSLNDITEQIRRMFKKFQVHIRNNKRAKKVLLHLKFSFSDNHRSQEMPLIEFRKMSANISI